MLWFSDPGFLLLVNPTSGGGNSLERLPGFRDLLAQKQIRYAEYISQSPEDFDAQILSPRNKGRKIIILGGDSALVRAIELCKLYKCNQTFAFFPAGSSNDIAIHLKTTHPPDAVSALLQGTEKIDCGEISNKHGKYFFLGQANIGIGAEVNMFVEKLKRKNKVWYKWQEWAGVYAICKTILRQKSVAELEIRFGSQSITGKFHAALFTKIKFWAGGRLFAPEASLTDGLLQLVLIRKCGLLRFLRILLAASQGKHIHFPEVSIYAAERFQVKSAQPFMIQKDGDIIEKSHTPLYFTEITMSAQKKSQPFFTGKSVHV